MECPAALAQVSEYKKEHEVGSKTCIQQKYNDPTISKL
jgi:hypothetical protein